jgi:hypothetical protein
MLAHCSAVSSRQRCPFRLESDRAQLDAKRQGHQMKTAYVLLSTFVLTMLVNMPIYAATDNQSGDQQATATDDENDDETTGLTGPLENGATEADFADSDSDADRSTDEASSDDEASGDDETSGDEEKSDEDGDIKAGGDAPN